MPERNGSEHTDAAGRSPQEQERRGKEGMKTLKKAGIGKVFGTGLKMYAAFLMAFVILFSGETQASAEDCYLPKRLPGL